MEETMKTNRSVIRIFALCFSLLLVSIAYARTSSGAQYVRQYLSGKLVERGFKDVSEGGGFSGTWYITQQIHICPSGRYELYEHGVKETILGNKQFSNREDSGTWDVISTGREILVVYHSNSGNRGSFPVGLLPDGRVLLPDNATITGRTRCR
jgi:hypothetical protein